MLTIWGRINSINVQKVLWCCAELGVAYERIDAGGSFGVSNTPEYLAMNPNGLVPTIKDDGFVLWESNVIVRYLAAKHGAGTLYPGDLRECAEADRWMDWQVTTLWMALRPLFFGYVRTPPEQRDAAALAAAQRSLRDAEEGELLECAANLGAPDKALQAIARLAAAAEDRRPFSHPFYWAPFVCYGR